MKYLSAAIVGLAGLSGLASATSVSSHNVFNKIMGNHRISALSSDPVAKSMMLELKAASELAQTPVEALRALESIVDGLVGKYAKSAEADHETYSAERTRRLGEYNEFSQKRGLHAKEIDASRAKIEQNKSEIVHLNDDLKAAMDELQTITTDEKQLEDHVVHGTQSRSSAHQDYISHKEDLIGDLKKIRSALKNFETGNAEGAVAFLESASGAQAAAKKSLIQAALETGHVDVILELVDMLRLQYEEDIQALTVDDVRLAAIWEHERTDLVNQLAQNRVSVEKLGSKASEIQAAVTKLSEENDQLSQVMQDRTTQSDAENQTVDDKLAILFDNGVSFEAKRSRNDRRLYIINLIRTVVDNCLSDSATCLSEGALRPNLRPHSCLEHRLNGKHVDGEYHIYADNSTDKAFTVWCNAMDLDTKADWSVEDVEDAEPRFASVRSTADAVAQEFLTVVPEHNFAIMYSGRQLNGWDCDGDLSNELYRFGGHQSFAKVRYDVRRRALVTNDWSYSTKKAAEGTTVPLGVAGDCYSWSKCPKGSFEIDLSGTSFHFPANVKDFWQTAGFAVTADIQLSDGGKRLSGVCGGWCGVCAPADEIPLELDA